MGRSVFSTALLSAIVFQISLGSTILLAADGATNLPPPQYSVFQPSDLELNEQDFLKSNEQFNENEKVFIEKYFNEPARVTLDLMILARALSEKADSIVEVADKEKPRITPGFLFAPAAVCSSRCAQSHSGGRWRFREWIPAS